MAWDINFDPGTNLIDVYVGYLRRQLGEPTITTIRGAGYRLQAGSQAAPNGPDSHRQKRPQDRRRHGGHRSE